MISHPSLLVYKVGIQLLNILFYWIFILCFFQDIAPEEMERLWWIMQMNLKELKWTAVAEFAESNRNMVSGANMKRPCSLSSCQETFQD